MAVGRVVAVRALPEQRLAVWVEFGVRDGDVGLRVAQQEDVFVVAVAAVAEVEAGELEGVAWDLPTVAEDFAKFFAGEGGEGGVGGGVEGLGVGGREEDEKRSGDE